LIGGFGDDILNGDRGDDSLAGGPGDDTYVFGADDFIGADTIAENPGEGSDTLDFSPTFFTSVGIDLRNTVSPQSVTNNGNLILMLSDHIENVTGGSHGNAIIGDAGVNILSGGNGVDYILGGGGADQIVGGGSEDILHGSSEAYVDGSDGADLIEFSGSAIAFPTNLLPVFHIAGKIPGTDYDQVQVPGDGRTVTLGGNLEVYLDDFTPRPGDRFTIVELQSALSVINGTFNHKGQSLAEGDSFTADGHRFRISYVAGDGNDVSLTHMERLPGADTVEIPRIGEVDVIVDGNNVVVRQSATELLRKPGSQLQGLRLTGTPGDDTYNIANLAAVYTGTVGGNSGAGYDTLRLTGSGQALDLTLISNELQGFEMIDIIGGGNNSLKLDVDAVLALSQSTHTLRVRHDHNGVFEFGGGWKTEKPEIVDNQFAHVLRQDSAKIEIVNSRPYHHPLRALDVDDDGGITLLDVLVVINRINSEGLGELAAPTSIADQTPFFYFDVNPDGLLSPLDVLIVINFLNDPTGNPEGEASFEPFMMPVVSKKVSRVDAAFQLNGRLTSAEGEFVSNPGMAITDKDKLHDRCDNILLIEGSIGIQDDLASLDVALADWGSRDWASAFFYLGDVIDDEDEDDPWGEEGLEVLFDGVSDKLKK
jgi:Ca2+-binding RTX toxin-like protein